MKKIILILLLFCFYLQEFPAAAKSEKDDNQAEDKTRTSILIWNKTIGNINKKRYIFMETPSPQENEVLMIYSRLHDNNWTMICQKFITGKRTGQTECFFKQVILDDTFYIAIDENNFDMLESCYIKLEAECEAKNKAEHEYVMEVATDCSCIIN